jgi:hypothetical protein
VISKVTRKEKTASRQEFVPGWSLWQPARTVARGQRQGGSRPEPLQRRLTAMENEGPDKRMAAIFGVHANPDFDKAVEAFRE